MQIAVTFRHMEADEGAKDYVKGKVKRLEKYVENPREAHVVLSVEKFRHTAEITILGGGLKLNSQGMDRDLYTAIDQMVEKIERQVRERRGKERGRRLNSSASNPLPQRDEDLPENQEAIKTSSLIRRRYGLAKPMSLEEAYDQLNLSEEDILFFINADSGQINALCRLKDGGYEWIEPHLK